MNKLTDFNDMATLMGFDTVKQTIDAATLPENSAQDGNEPNKLSEAQPIQNEEIVDQLNKIHAVVLVGGQSVILTESITHKGEQEILLGRFSDMNTRYANQREITTNLLNKAQDASYAEIWMRSPRRRSYLGIVFAPQGAPDEFYNLFKGFAVKPAQGDCSLYLQHLCDNICRGNKGYYEYLLSWMAHMIQHPGELPGIAIVFRGGQGVGKGVATEELGRLVEPHYIALTGMEQLVGRFTGHLKDKILVFNCIS